MDGKFTDSVASPSDSLEGAHTHKFHALFSPKRGWVQTRTPYTISKLSIIERIQLATLEDSDKTGVRLDSSWIIPQPLKEKQQFSVQAVGFVKIPWVVMTHSYVIK